MKVRYESNGHVFSSKEEAEQYLIDTMHSLRRNLVNREDWKVSPIRRTTVIRGNRTTHTLSHTIKPIYRDRISSRHSQQVSYSEIIIEE
jgi:hypothetical protein